ncbi:unnamed protein product, partial [Didymodactylos carnosus]
MSMYNITYGGKHAKREPRLRQSVAAFSNQYFNRTTIKSFGSVYAKKFHLNVGKIYGINNASIEGDEATLHTEYMTAMGSGIPTDFISISITLDATSAYMTSVGGILLIRSITNTNCTYVRQEPRVRLQEVVASPTDKTLCSITSGGGFSAYVLQPDYQKAFVDHYLQISRKKIPPSIFFNSSGRAVPDISFAAVNFVTTVNGQTFAAD